ncbi:uncharacterized protein LOC131328381 [Rhododendron vialii]|uniref:uncharacterized protein LOC131316645 n=2 Tax=Rhododendron vialii TaxID=182163 RepID=UPI00265FA522|nr:uncharacterized protein LOC131316645 [Rhododendron vialii]XP_058217312.1 uncharacterized protein LOC131328381 [Rhododendron vialii]
MAGRPSPRHNWVQDEEMLLISELKSMAVSRLWTTSSGHFRPSYTSYLKRFMNNDFPDASIEEWHIEAKIKKWRRTCFIIVNLLDRPGFEWDASQNMVVAEDDVWDAFIQVNKQAREARDVQFPLFEDWRVCFISPPEEPEE